MPVYDYRCTSCNSNYDVLHKGKELQENIVCPKCGSKEYKKLMSVSSINMNGSRTSSGRRCEDGSCNVPYAGGCADGMCGLN
jgi:putative FmdB family regulatory protein